MSLETMLTLICPEQRNDPDPDLVLRCLFGKTATLSIAMSLQRYTHGVLNLPLEWRSSVWGALGKH